MRSVVEGWGRRGFGGEKGRGERGDVAGRCICMNAYAMNEINLSVFESV